MNPAPETITPDNPSANLPRSSRDGWLVFLTLLLLPLLYFYPATLGWLTLVPGDGWTSNFGVRVLVGKMIAHGQLPLWNPYIFGGMPLLAAIYPGALYPPNWLFAVLSPGAAMNVVVITSYHIALFGAYLYARRIGLTRLGALVTAITFAFSGFAIAHLVHTHRITAVIWLPWIVLAVEQLYHQASWRWITLGAVCVALQVYAGEPQMTFYTMLVCAAITLFSLFFREEKERRWKFVVAAIMLAVCAALLSAIQMLPQLELLREGARAKLDYDYFSGYSLPPVHLLTMIFPFYFGGGAIAPYKQPFSGEWNVAVVASYTGLLGLMLVISALFGRQQRRQVWFWVVIAVTAMLLSFGRYLPFEIYRLLYLAPGYNLFRGSYRHMLEFSFAMAVLAGLGVDCLAQAGRATMRQLPIIASGLVLVLTGWATMSYRLLSDKAQTSSISDVEVLVPLIVFIIAVLALWFHAQQRSRLSGVMLVIALLVDLGSYGQFADWRAVKFTANERMADPPAVAFIKEREKDLQSFRTLTISSLPSDYDYRPPHDLNYDLVNQPDVSIARGLQSVSGYDVLRLTRMSEMAGEIDLGGVVLDVGSLAEKHRGFDLLNVRYLLRERRREFGPQDGLPLDGIRFAKTPLHLLLAPGKRFVTEPGEVTTNELAIVSLLSDSAGIPDGTPVVKIKLHTTDNRIIERELQAGRDTSEWAWDRPDVRRVIRHKRAQVVESTEVKDAAGNYQSHSYLARLSFDRAVIDRLEFEYVQKNAQLQIVRASLLDTTNGTTWPLDDLPLESDKWRKLGTFGDVWLYENLKALPRAWFAPRVEALPEAEILLAIKEGRLKNGSAFDPLNTALVETAGDDAGSLALLKRGDPANAEVSITGYEPQRIELRTRNSQEGFLVLSEIYLRGWEARVDYRETPIHRTDYTLRGIVVPAGEHRIEFTYRPKSFKNGAMASGIGVLVLIVGSFLWPRWMHIT